MVQMRVEGPLQRMDLGQQNVAATTCECNDGLVVTFALTDLACVVRPGYRVLQRCERRQEHRAFELFISSARRMFASVRGRVRASRHRREPRVGSQISCGSERSTRYIDQEYSGGPDARPRHAVRTR